MVFSLLSNLKLDSPQGQKLIIHSNTFFTLGLIEFEMEDPNVPSHAIVKLRSKQLVDAQVSEFDVPDAPAKK